VDDELLKTKQKRLLGILCSLAIIAVLIATLWPFDFFRPNGVRWLPEANGIQFFRPGVVVSKAPLEAGGIDSEKSCSVEILLRPAGVESFSHNTIFNSYDPGGATQFLLRQWRDDLLVSRYFVDSRNRPGKTEFYAMHVFQQGKVLLLTITSARDGTAVYIDGGHMRVYSALTISQSDCAGRIALGSSASNYAPWPGEVRGLAIYSKALAPADVARHYGEWTGAGGVAASDLEGAVARYDFAEGDGRDIHDTVASGPDLEIPTRFEVPGKAMLESPRKEMRENEGYLRDVWENIAGFVPVGFVVCAYLACTRSRKQAILYAILAGGSLSFVIEVLQAYIPQRGSGVTDIITNTTGAALGAVLARPNIVRTILGRGESSNVEGEKGENKV
jgi:hypothetical protein